MNLGPLFLLPNQSYFNSNLALTLALLLDNDSNIQYSILKNFDSEIDSVQLLQYHIHELITNVTTGSIITDYHDDVFFFQNGNFYEIVAEN